MPAIPLDVVDQVLRYLVADIQTLRECSLVCKAWVHPSQRLIFNKFVFHLHHDANYTKCARQATIIADSPHLAAYIRGVDIHIGSPRERDPLVPLLRKFTNTRSLLFNSLSHAQWTDLPTELRLSIEKMLSSPTFETLNLFHWVFEPQQANDFLKHCSSTLRSLGLWSVVYKSSDQEEEIQALELPRLRELSIHGHLSFPPRGTLQTPNVDVVGRRLHNARCETLCRALLAPDIPLKASGWAFYIYLSNCIANEGCSAINFDDLVNLRRLRLTIACRMLVIDPAPPRHRTLAISALGRIALGIPTTLLKTVSIDFICDSGPAKWDKDAWDQMATTLEPFLNTAKLLDRVTFTIEDAYDESSMIMDLIEKHFEYLKPRLELRLKAL